MPFEDGNLPTTHRRPTRGRFKEFSKEGTESLEDWRQRFVDCCDPTEYKAALELCGSWDEWKRFKELWPGFAPILEDWLNEVEIKLRSQAVSNIIKKAENDINAAKFIAKGEYKRQVDEKLSKRERQREKVVQAQVARKIDRDAERVLNLIENKDYVDISPQSEKAI